jgi:hypothetical protein
MADPKNELPAEAWHEGQQSPEGELGNQKQQASGGMNGARYAGHQKRDEEAQEQETRAEGLTCKVCRAAITNQEEFEASTRSDAMCTECMYKASSDK